MNTDCSHSSEVDRAVELGLGRAEAQWMAALKVGIIDPVIELGRADPEDPESVFELYWNRPCLADELVRMRRGRGRGGGPAAARGPAVHRRGHRGRRPRPC